MGKRRRARSKDSAGLGEASRLPFLYPSVPHERRHGPRGYSNYESYKPWLRDEFVFRCVYCLCRERWFPDGDDYFSVDHFRSRKRAPEHRTAYENLLYACCQCNASKQDSDWIVSPCEEAMATHLEVLEDGTIRGLTVKGKGMDPGVPSRSPPS